MKPTRTLYALALFVLSLSVVSCTKTRHVFVVADVAFARAVFAVDDAQMEACRTHVPPFTVQVCAETDVQIDAALADVKALTAALQATPKDGPMPKNIPDLIKSLSNVQAMLSPLTPSLVKADLARKIQNALNQAIAVLTLFSGATL